MPRIPSSVSQQTLRKLADRARVVLARHAATDKALEIAAGTVVPAADAMIAAYDAARTFESRQSAATAQGARALDALHTRIRAWVGLLVEAVPGFDQAGMEGTPTQPEHLFADAKRIVELVQAQSTPQPYAEQLIADLNEHTERARTEWSSSRDAIVQLQRLRAEVRTAAEEFSKRLIGLRRTLRAVLGSSHHDYQALRAGRVQHVEEETPAEQDSEAATDLGTHGASGANGATPPAFTQ